MASVFRNCLMNSECNERLYTDFYFWILQLKKSDSRLECLIREFIRQTNVHCSEQNMTPLGSQKFKSELYIDYSKTMDMNEDGLACVSDDGDTSSVLSPNKKQQVASVYALKFTNFLLSFKKLTTNEIKLPVFNSVTPQSDKKSTLIVGKDTFSDCIQDKSVSLNKKIALNETNQKSIAKKKKLYEIPERFYSSKKVCVHSTSYQKKSTNATDVGFVSASTMYHNPMKKKNNKTEEKITNSSDECSELKNHDTLKNFDKKIVDIVLKEIMDFSPNIRWSDIAGLEFVKTTVQEIVIWPILRPDIFTGLRAPPRGILLFGPPGTGKTLIGKCIATESNSTFFCISASSLASKWVGESEQMVRVLFAAARLNQPAVIFIDEIDSLLSQRSDKDQDFTRKLKTEFLVQFDGAKTNTEERVLVVGATNRPHELDEAARRRFVKRLYVPLPDEAARKQIVCKLIETHQHNLSDVDLRKICDETKGYSGSDVAHLCKEAAMGPIRSIGSANIKTVSLDQVRPISLCDFIDALCQVRASVVADDLNYYMDWNKKFGSFGIPS